MEELAQCKANLNSKSTEYNSCSIDKQGLLEKESNNNVQLLLAFIAGAVVAYFVLRKRQTKHPGDEMPQW